MKNLLQIFNKKGRGGTCVKVCWSMQICSKSTIWL